MKMKSKLLAVVSVLLIAMLMLCGCSKDSSAKSDANAQPMEITFEVVGADGASEKHQISTQKETLAEALDEAGLIEYDKAGMYTVIDGVRADYTQDGAFWWIKVNGKDATTGMNDIKIEDGGQYAAIYTPA
jgi:ABC-type phosphate/phosphonate transport system substrate-binding protein